MFEHRSGVGKMELKDVSACFDVYTNRQHVFVVEFFGTIRYQTIVHIQADAFAQLITTASSHHKLHIAFLINFREVFVN